jgi:serine/threonine protein phosphatase PrpC
MFNKIKFILKIIYFQKLLFIYKINKKMSSLPKNRKTYNNYINNSLKKFPLDRYIKNDLAKDNNKNHKKKILLNSINSQSKDRLISKNLNNSANYVKSNNSFNKTKKPNQNNKFHKNGHNWKLKLIKNNNIHQNMNNSLREKKIDILYPQIKSIYKNNSKNKDMNLSQRINMNFLSPFIKNKNDKAKEKIKFKKIENNSDPFRSKTPIIMKNIDNSSKTVNRSYNTSSRPKKKKYKNSLLYSGANLNINNIIKKKNSALKKIRNVIFQSNNIFYQYKPKKKSKILINQENLQLKQTLLNPFLNKETSSNENINSEINKTDNNSKYFIEIHPKIIQQQETEKLKKDKSGNEISPLTTNSTNMNMLLNNNSTANNLRYSSSDIISSVVLKPQQFNQFNSNSTISNNNNNYNNSDSNAQLNLNIYSSRSLHNNNNNNRNILKENNNNNNYILANDSFKINNNKSNKKNIPEFKGKKIKCIHDISKTGLSGDEKKVNQDRDFIFHNFVSGFENIFMGVCDGHGLFGHEISEYIKENLPMDLNRIIKSKKLDLNKDDLSKVLIDTFDMENNSLLRNKQIDSDLSGSTCVSVIYTPQKLIIANLGDSRCVLGKKINNIEWKYENLSRDHKPDVKEEADRIKKAGGRIRPMIDEDGCFVGPMRVYMKDKDMPGLAMTRSFGDYLASIAGTISIPEVKEHILSKEDKFIILASDGLFEFISSEEVGNIVKGYYEKNDIVGCCEFLYKESYRKWIQEEEDTVDDITIILVFFED